MLITTQENNLESRKCILFKCVLVAFIVFFSCFLLFNGCGVAKASDIPENAKDVFISDLESIGYSYSTYQSYFDSAFSFDYVTRIKTDSNFCWIFQKYEFAGIGVGTSNTTGYFTINNTNRSWSQAGLRSIDTYYVMNVSSNTPIQYTVTYFNGRFYLSYYYVPYSNPSSSIMYKLSLYPSVSYSSMSGKYNNDDPYCSRVVGSEYYSDTNFSFEDVITNHHFYYQDYSLGNGFLFTDNWEYYFPASVEDDRLKITTINDSYGNKDLVLDFTEFGTSTNAATYTYSDLSLTYTIDDVSYTLTDIDSYIEQIGDVQGLIDIMAFIPYSSLETFTEYNNVILTNVSFTRTISSAGGSGSETFNILTNYYINKSSSESGMDNIEYSTDVSGDKATQEQIDTIYYNINFVEGNQISFDEMYEGENTFPSNWSEHYVYLKNVTAAWNDLFEDAAVTPFELFSTITEVCPDVDSAINHISTYLYTTNIANTFDVIIFDYIQETSTSYTHTYWYYTTVCGRIRAMSSIAADLYVDTNQIAVNTKETYNYLKLRLDDFEDKSLNKLDNIISNGNSTLSWLHTIDFDLSSGFNSVVNAINNIDVPEQDNTDIINKLSDVISAINNIGSPATTNEIDTPQECIEYYRDNINTDIEDIPLQYRVAYFEGMTLDKLYTYGISSNNDTRLASTSDSEYTDQSIFIIKYFYDTILDVMNNSSMYNNLVEGINDIGDNSTYFYDMFDTDFDITVYHGFR